MLQILDLGIICATRLGNLAAACITPNSLNGKGYRTYHVWAMYADCALRHYMLLLEY